MLFICFPVNPVKGSIVQVLQIRGWRSETHLRLKQANGSECLGSHYITVWVWPFRTTQDGEWPTWVAVAEHRLLRTDHGGLPG